MRRLDPCEEVLLQGGAAAAAMDAGYNPYYGLVVEDPGPQDAFDERHGLWPVRVLWDDGREHVHPRAALVSWAERHFESHESGKVTG